MVCGSSCPTSGPARLRCSTRPLLRSLLPPSPTRPSACGLGLRRMCETISPRWFSLFPIATWHRRRRCRRSQSLLSHRYLLVGKACLSAPLPLPLSLPLPLPLFPRVKLRMSRPPASRQRPAMQPVETFLAACALSASVTPLPAADRCSFLPMPGNLRLWAEGPLYRRAPRVFPMEALLPPQQPMRISWGSLTILPPQPRPGAAHPNTLFWRRCPRTICPRQDAKQLLETLLWGPGLAGEVPPSARRLLWCGGLVPAWPWGVTRREVAAAGWPTRNLSHWPVRSRTPPARRSTPLSCHKLIVATEG
eukprot:Rmarinus@m.19324